MDTTTNLQDSSQELEVANFDIKIEPRTPTTPEIRNLIYTIRGKQVMLDSDLATLFEVETGALNRAASRNKGRFPEDFRFQLTKEELNDLRCQIGILPGHSQENTVGRTYLPHAYTEQGVAMLSAVLRSEVAVQASIQIMRAFVEMRHFITDNALMFARVNELESWRHDTDKRLDFVFDFIEEHQTLKPTHRIYFQGQVWDALSLLEDLIHAAEHEIILIDGYIDKLTLDILSHKREGVTVHAYTLPSAQLTKHEVQTFNTQHPTLELYHTTAFHDRYLVLDGTTCYHIGASLKDAGKKGFSINLIQDQAVINALLAELDRLATC